MGETPDLQSYHQFSSHIVATPLMSLVITQDQPYCFFILFMSFVIKYKVNRY